MVCVCACACAVCVCVCECLVRASLRLIEGHPSLAIGEKMSVRRSPLLLSEPLHMSQDLSLSSSASLFQEPGQKNTNLFVTYEGLESHRYTHTNTKHTTHIDKN